MGISEKIVMRLGQDLGNSSTVSAYQDMIRALLSRIIDEKILIYCSAAGKASDGRKPIPSKIYDEILCKNKDILKKCN